jgi:hypothetical protein
MSMRAKLGAAVTHARFSGTEITTAARTAGPGRISYWERQVDPENQLSAEDRRQRAEHAKKAHYLRLAALSAAKRARR